MSGSSTGGIGGIAPTTSTANPITQGMIQRYASLPVEKLQELSGMMGGTPQGQIIQSVLRQKQVMSTAQQQGQPQTPTQQQQGMTAQPAATGIALPGAAATTSPQQPQLASGGIIPRRAAGGMMSIPLSMADPSWSRMDQSESQRSPVGQGFLSGATGGRTDAIRTTAPGGAYVIPADVISGLGEGNSLAGAKVMQSVLSSGPYGTPLPRGGRGMGAPRPPQQQAQATGGATKGGGVTPVMLSDGEFVVSPQQVMAIGGGNLKRGHAVLDKFVVQQRKAHIEKLKKLPGPVKA